MLLLMSRSSHLVSFWTSCIIHFTNHQCIHSTYYFMTCASYANTLSLVRYQPIHSHSRFYSTSDFQFQFTSSWIRRCMHRVERHILLAVRGRSQSLLWAVCSLNSIHLNMMKLYIFNILQKEAITQLSWQGLCLVF